MSSVPWSPSSLTERPPHLCAQFTDLAHEGDQLIPQCDRIDLLVLEVVPLDEDHI